MSAFRNRDPELHQDLAHQMLYKGIVGTEILNHPEWQAVRAGFSLPCRMGFDVRQVVSVSIYTSAVPAINSIFSLRLSRDILVDRTDS